MKDRIEIEYVFGTKPSRCRCGGWTLLFFATLLMVAATLSLIWTPFRTLLNERLRMRPGFPPYEWWMHPPDVLVRFYAFNVTNTVEFLSGVQKLRVEEVGPIVFAEHLTHDDVAFNDNNTLSYTAKRTLIYRPELNTLDLNATLHVPNHAVLGIASYLWDSSFIIKMGFNMMVRGMDPDLIVATTLYNYMWNFTDPLVDVAQTFAPAMIPHKNAAMLYNMYADFNHRITVKIGTEHGPNHFFLIEKFDGSSSLPHCPQAIFNSTEGVAYPQFLSENTTLFYWRKTICKAVSLQYERNVRTHGLTAYRFIMKKSTFDHREHDCHTGEPPLPNGFNDVSKCYHNFPMASSFPHFLYAANPNPHVEGLRADPEKHGSYVHIEPVTGIPIESKARMQSNLVVKPLSGFNEAIERFSDTIIPMFWMEYNQVDLPFCINVLVYFMVEILPHFQYVITATMISTSALLAIYSIRTLCSNTKIT